MPQDAIIMILSSVVPSASLTDKFIGMLIGKQKNQTGDHATNI